MSSIDQGYTVLLNRPSLSARTARTPADLCKWFASVDSRMTFQRLHLVTAKNRG